MKNAELVKIRGDLGPEALRILRDVPGVAVEAAGAGRGDAEHTVVRFGPASEPVALAVRRQANAATAWQLVREAQAAPATNLLVVAAATTAEAREILERHGVAVVDGLGNAHVELPGLVLHTEGRRRQRERPAPRAQARLAGKAGVAAQALLLDPARDWKVQDLAGEAHVSLGLAHRVLARLEREGLVGAEGAGPRRVRRLADPTALLDLWAEENADRGVRRVRAYRLARDPRELAGAVSASLAAAGVEHAVTGVAAAALVAPFVTAIPVSEVWVDPRASLDEAVTATGGEIVDTGSNLVLVQGNGDEPLAFRRQVEGAWTVNPVRLFYDLRRDPRRGREQAERLRQEVIGF
ncbi:MAG TPA: hypothetical protein VKE97_11015 [Acidimicrobiia bacterium]|nr:hypothetical protein [Acidimicrobiia bacterium]